MIPTFSEAEAARLARRLYGVDGVAVELPSERDQNFLVRVEGDSGTASSRHVLKIANSDQSYEVLDFQVSALAHAHARDPSVPLPLVLTTRRAQNIARVDGASGSEHLVRLLTYLPGRPLATLQTKPMTLLEQIGSTLARVDQALADFTHPVMDRAIQWDVARAPEVRNRIEHVDAGRRALVESALSRYDRVVAPLLRWLPQSVIHNDGNDHNLLVDDRDTRIVGLLDTGDMVRTARVAEAAIAAAYAMLDQDEPLEAAAALVGSYHRTLPLTAAEIDLVLELIRTRLAMSVTIAAARAEAAETNPYLRVSEEAAWHLLDELAGVDPDAASERLRDACPLVAEGRPKEDLIAARRSRLGPSLSISYRTPLKIVRGSGPWLFDEVGRAYLDGVNNVCHVGHCHPRVVAAAESQMHRLNTNTRYLHDHLVEYTERLTATLPDPLEVCYFVCSGSEANELALRLARAHTGRDEVLAVEGAYHGNTQKLVGISHYKFSRKGGAGQPPWVHIAPMPDDYRGPYQRADPEAGRKYADDLCRVLDAANARAGAGGRHASEWSSGGQATARPPEPGIGAFICESILSCGGQIVLPPGYLREVFGHVREAGAVCIVDEVQVGFGRSGSRFWAFETQDVVPDIVTMGKPMGNGHPLAAVVTTAEIAASFANGMEYFSSFGGNPVSCAVGMAVLDVIEQEELQENALRVGRYLLEGFEELRQRHPLVGDARGLGLFVGLEFVRDRTTLEPAAEEAAELVERMKQRGVLVSTDGPLENVIKMKPPMVFTERHADIVLRGFDEELSRMDG